MKRRLNVKMLLIGTIASLLLASCGYSRVANFVKADLSGASGQKTGIMLMSHPVDWGKKDPILEIIDPSIILLKPRQDRNIQESHHENAL